MTYIKIQEIKVGGLNQYTANAIAWSVAGLHRGATSAIADCALIFVNADGSTIHVPDSNFEVYIDNDNLQAWGSDDGVIDNLVIAYSEKFVKA
jgi:hypothetical protein